MELKERIAKILCDSVWGTGAWKEHVDQGDDDHINHCYTEAEAIQPIIEEQVQARTAELVKLLVELEDKAKALEVIESLVSDGFCEDMAMDRARERDISQEDARLMARKIGTIYRFSHSVNAHSCYDVHDNWREEMVDLYDKLEEEK